MTPPPANETPDTVEGALEALQADVSSVDGVTAEIHDDDSEMTPMLAVTFEGSSDRTEVLRTLFHADGPVAVDSVHSHKVVVRGDV